MGSLGKISTFVLHTFRENICNKQLSENGLKHFFFTIFNQIKSNELYVEYERKKQLLYMKCYVSFQVLLCRESQIHISGHRMGVSLYYLSSYSYSFLLPFLGGFQGTTMYHPPAL